MSHLKKKQIFLIIVIISLLGFNRQFEIQQKTGHNGYEKCRIESNLQAFAP